MELDYDAKQHWLDVFGRALDEGTETEVIQMTLRLETFLERLDERQDSTDGTCADDEVPFDFGSGY